MIALTVRQRYAGFIAAGLKQWETRTRITGTKFRGELIIHAGMARPTIDAFLIDGLDAAGHREVDRLCSIFGAAICVVEITDIVPVEEIRDSISPFERSVGDYSDRRVAMKIENVRLLREPIPARGVLGLWKFPVMPEFDT
jgi:hypothetical protein